MSLNAAGFGFFGPVLSAELGGKLSGHAGLRLFSLGALSHVLFVDDNATVSFGSIGASLGGRYYLGEQKFQGFYVGAAAELLALGFENEAVQIKISRRVLVPAAEVGYRFRWGRWLFGLGARAGYAFELSKDCEPLAGANVECTALAYDNTAYGEGVLDLGFAF